MGKDSSLHRLAHPVTGYREWVGAGVALWWLGQAGFLIRHGSTNIVIDAYMSDVLALKYKGQVYPHVRMMPPPIPMEDLTGIDFFICSHSHSDHMDPGLIPVIRDGNPSCRFLVPEAARTVGVDRGIPEEMLIGLDAGSDIALTEGIGLRVIPSAHESQMQDGNGHHAYLGFIFRFGKLCLYHPGDCLPYPGYDDWLSPHRIDLALMPVNGREEELSRHGIAGNFSFTEASGLMREHNMRFMISHHYGMFDFNSVDRDELERGILDSGVPDRIFPAETGILYHLTEG